MAETVERAPEGGKTGNTTHAAVAYILTWLTGLIIYLVADDDDAYARWHAIQAIGLGIVAVVVGWILGIVGGILALGAGRMGSPLGFLGMGVLLVAWWLLLLVLIVVLAYKAYQGDKLRLPIIAGFADDHA